MRLPVTFSTFAALGAMALLLTGCGPGDYNGFGETEGWGGYTKGFGDVDEGNSSKQVGLCSYLGGCMPEQADDDSAAKTAAAAKKSSHPASTMDDSQ